MDEAERVEIAGHVGRLGHELIRFAELARARLNAMQDFSDVPTLALQDDVPPSMLVMAKEVETLSAKLRLPQPQGKRGQKGLPKALPEDPEPPESPAEGAVGVALATGTPTGHRPLLLNEEPAELLSSPELTTMVTSCQKARGFFPTPSPCRDVKELPEPPQSPDQGVPKSTPRRFFPTPPSSSLRSQAEELPEPPQSPDQGVQGVPKSTPKRFLPTPPTSSLRSQTEELPEPPQSPDQGDDGVALGRPWPKEELLSSKPRSAELEPGTPEPPWSPEREASPPLRRVQLFAEEAPEPPWAPPPEVEGSSSSEGPAMMEKQMSSRPTQPRSTKAPTLGALRGRRAKKRLATVGRAALVIGRLHAEVLDLRKRMVAMEVAPSTSSRAETVPSVRSVVGTSSQHTGDTGMWEAPEAPEAPEEALDVVGSRGSSWTKSSARSRSRSSSVDYWAELKEVEPGGSEVSMVASGHEKAKEATSRSQKLEIQGEKISSPDMTLQPPAAPPEEESKQEVLVSKETTAKAAKGSTVHQGIGSSQVDTCHPAGHNQPWNYWLQVDSIFGLKEGLYEVQGYWLTHVTDVVRLPATKTPPLGGDCVVRNQVLLPPGGSGRLAVEVVQKTSDDVLYVGRADVDTRDGSSRQLFTYELPPSSNRVRLRICPHPAGPGTVQAKTSATPAVPPVAAGSAQTGVVQTRSVALPAPGRASKEVVESDAVAEQPTGPSSGQKPGAPVEDEGEDSEWEYFEEEEEEEPREHDPVVSS